MAEPVELWWARRQWSKALEVPYPVGCYRSDWERYPVLVRQYHPDLNSGITLTQVPPAAEVYLVWQCDVGHRFVATPDEQRQRPGQSRRRSTWCPECAAGATKRRAPSPSRSLAPVRPRSPAATARVARPAPGVGEVGEAFVSSLAPKPASAAEGELRHRLAERLDLDFGLNAVRVARPFFTRHEVWPDIVLAELRVAIEYDTTGRDGLEHVGRREETDRRKDRLLRAAGWEVVRIRCGKLRPIGPFDLTAPGISAKTIERLVEKLGEIRGDLIVECYRRTEVLG
ncbi:zinc-ribbon domain-containing protein [Lacisediminihabitans sp. H27-G8]|uniref:zinc-ribbon domain-containing protein n=1 Tax=Lacisediminihabitans sp. H27-G8 TaxID=3111909 RepID=UPI0038FD188B